MRYAIISDVHANLEALEAVLKHIDSLAVDKILCLGDVVGYGANPNECTEIIRNRAAITLLGNHDHAATGGTSITRSLQNGRIVVHSSRRELGFAKDTYQVWHRAQIVPFIPRSRSAATMSSGRSTSMLGPTSNP